MHLALFAAVSFLRKFIDWIQKHRLWSGAVAVGVGLILFYGIHLAKRSSGTLSEPLKLSPIVQSVYGIGTVTASQSYQIKVGLVSTIFHLYVKEGDTVTKGTPLVDIDHNIYRAPFDGTVTALPYKIGENIFSQLPVLSLVNLKDRYVVVSLEQQGALRVLKGQKAKLSFDSIRDQSYDGVVSSVYSSNGSFLARIDVSGFPDKILPDMTADVAITLVEKPDALIVPVAALDHGKLWVKRGKGLVKVTEVKIGIVDRAMAEIVSGDVKAGDQVLIKMGSAP